MSDPHAPKLPFWKRPELRQTLWMMSSHGLRLVLQGVYFITVTQALGPKEYGAFVGAAAFVDIVAPFSTLGAGNLLVKNVARDRSTFSTYWGNGLWLMIVSASLLIIGLEIVGAWILPKTISPWLLLFAAMTNLLGGRALDLTANAYQSVQKIQRTAQFTLLPHIIRAVAALMMVKLIAQPTAIDWALVSLLSIGSAGLIAILCVSYELGKPQLALKRLKGEVQEGSYFAVGYSAQTVYNDIDKTMLARLSTLEATGMYAAAYRLIDMAFVPLKSILTVAYAKFFKQGATGIRGSVKVAKGLFPIMAGYGFIAGVGLLFCSPIVPWILGEKYAASVQVLQWLAPLVFLKGLHYIAADALSGADLQFQRSVVQISIAVLNVLLNLWLIPRFSWHGAVISTLISDGLLMLILWSLIAWRYRQERLAAA
ncbi:oligosaccharide flippase family protein [filamentous cyanobacterium LEGE 11480]|uniref:Oligosaccharide flippase family protein n=1 Tax=Romeriopsis navalis LEGE 11480 TaxID=2777977 RepID=A0A928VH08_9CYAN|nr:oligosaccharide flippase family protein [Romeriopsis navalis]MBE9028461.1 oligosaccharide flippase family protein [Romeriopsis navalis LEGE 11480]